MKTFDGLGCRQFGGACLLAFALAGCGDSPGSASEPPSFEQAASSKQRLPATASPEVLRTLTRNNAEFALDLVRAEAPAGNYFFSPHSISLALAMTYAGSAGTTRDEIAATLNFSQPEAELHGAFNSLDQALAERGQSGSFRLNLANSSWAQQDYAFLPTYLDVLAEDYGAAMNLLDFSADAEGSRRTINGWVDWRTGGNIPELLPEGIVDGSTRLVLTNAVYFDAAWDVAFKPEHTSPGDFVRLDGSTVSVPMLHGAQQAGRAAGDGWQAVSLDYAGKQLSLLVVLPDAGEFANVAAAMNADQLNLVFDALVPQQLEIALPKFEFRTKLDLSERLKQMGMPSAFGEASDFSRMDGTRQLYLAAVVHEAFVQLNEAGTKAAAASGAVINTRTATPIQFRLDRPFLFFIVDQATRAVLFAGQLLDPNAPS